MGKKYLAYQDQVIWFFIFSIIIIVSIVFAVVKNTTEIVYIFTSFFIILFFIMFKFIFSKIIINQIGITKKSFKTKIFLSWEEIRQIYVIAYSRLGPMVLVNASEREMEKVEETNYSYGFTLTKKIKRSLYEYCPREDLKVMIDRMEV